MLQSILFTNVSKIYFLDILLVKLFTSQIAKYITCHLHDSNAMVYSKRIVCNYNIICSILDN